MRECAVCGISRELGYICSYCGRYHCSEHRLPEAHNCQPVVGDSGGDDTPDPISPSTVGTTPDVSPEGSPDVAPDGSIASASGTTGVLGSVASAVWFIVGLFVIVGQLLRRRSVILLIALAIVGGLVVSGVVTPTLDRDEADIAVPEVPNITVPDADFSSAETNVSAAGGTVRGLNRTTLEAAIHERINDQRQAHGLSPLSADPELREIARYHSRDMDEADYFAHTAPDGETMADRYEQFGYHCRVSTGDGRYATGAENIHITRFSGTTYTVGELAEQIVADWMDSQGHRENILRPYWNREGVGVYLTTDGGDTVVYTTQNFC